jgi:uncharacterized protein YoxC
MNHRLAGELISLSTGGVAWRDYCSGGDRRGRKIHSRGIRTSRKSSVLYLKHKENSMTDILLGIGVATFVVYAAFNIVYLMNMQKNIDSVGAFLRNTESNVNAALVELKGTLENLRKVSGDIGAVTSEVKQIADTVATVERSMRGVYQYAKEGLGSAAGAKIAGFKAGLTTGVVTLVKRKQVRKEE